MADGDALHITRTKASSAVAMIRRHSKSGARSGRAGFRVRSERISGAGGPVRGNPSPPNEAGLLELGLGTGVEQLLDSGFGIGLGNTLFYVLRSAIDQVLAFLQPHTGDFARAPDDRPLVGARPGQQHVEFGLFFDGRCTRATGRSRS